MQYTFLGFSQEKLLELELDDRDAALLDFFVRFKDSGSMYSEQVDGETYYWVKYEYIRKELPLIGNKLKKDSLYRRFKKMADKGVLKHYCKKSGGTYSFYALGDKYYSLLSSSEKKQPFQSELPLASSEAKPTSSEEVSIPSGDKSVPSGDTSVPSGDKSVPSGDTSVPSDFISGQGTDVKPEGCGFISGAKDQSIKDQSTKKIREREDAPALALFVENFPDVNLNDQKKADIRNTVTNLEAWKYTIWWWKFKEYRAERTDNMLNYYLNKAVPKLAATTSASSAPDTTVDPLGSTTQTDSGNPWNRILTRLQRRINLPSFNTWLRPVTAEISDHIITLTVPNEVYEYWLREYYITAIQEEAAKVLNVTPTINFQTMEIPTETRECR